MRISTAQAFNNGIANMQNSYGNLSKLYQQISTGKRVLTPGDDPVATARLQQLGLERAALEQYGKNITTANNNLNQEESMLQSVNTLYSRVRELAIRGGNSNLSAADRQSIAVEIKKREEELYDLLNSRDAQGEYLFGGHQGKTQPFVRDANGYYIYQGDEGQREVQIAGSQYIAISDSGKELFGTIPNAARLKLDNSSSPPPPNGAISGALVNDKVSFAKFPKNGITVSFNDPANPGAYTITPSGGGTPITGKLNENGEDTLVYYGGVKFYINANATDDSGNTYSMDIKPPIDNSSLNTANSLNMLVDLRRPLESSDDTPEGARKARDATNQAIINMDNAIDAELKGRGVVGARKNVLDSAKSSNEDLTLLNKTVTSQLEDVDYPSAISQLAMESTLLTAAQKSYMTITGNSLFNYM